MRVVILDRDGVINYDSDAYIKSPAEWNPIPGSVQAIARLHQAGYQIAIATNQSGVARKLFDIETLHRIHEKMLRKITQAGGQIDMISFCPHGPDDHCACRKPEPGLFLDIARRMSIDLTGVTIIGDSLRDIEAARRVGAQPVLVQTGNGEQALRDGSALQGVPVYRDLAAAVTAELSG